MAIEFGSRGAQVLARANRKLERMAASAEAEEWTGIDPELLPWSFYGLDPDDDEELLPPAWSEQYEEIIKTLLAAAEREVAKERGEANPVCLVASR